MLATVPQPLDSAKVARIVAEAGEPEEPASAAGATAAGDERKLRGVPAVGRGVAGAIPGTNPLAAVLAREARRRG